MKLNPKRVSNHKPPARIAGVYGDDGWEREDYPDGASIWTNYSLSDNVVTVYYDPELDGSGVEYIVHLNGAETMADDYFTQSFGDFDEALAYAETIGLG